MFFDFQFRSLCGIARIPYAAGGLDKNLENSTLAGPCFRVPKSAENRTRSKVPPEYPHISIFLGRVPLPNDQ